MNLPWILAESTGGSGNVFSAAYWFGSAGASAQAKQTESLFMYILWVNIIAFVVLMVLMFYFVAKYRRGKEKTNYQVSASHNTPLELAWSIIPLLVMVPIFYYGFTGYVDKLAAPSDAEVITIIGQKWNWTAVYRNGAQPRQTTLLTHTNYDVPEIIVPAGRPVKLVMTSEDVIHAFYIPDFRTKMDVIPNRYTSMWFLPEDIKQDGKAPVYKVFCAEYCGEKHSEMAAMIRVVPPQEFDATIHAWATQLPEGDITKVGEFVWKMKGCKACHTIDGGDSTGPTWKNHFGYEHEYSDGSKHVADEQWLHDNILNSQLTIIKGRPTTMPIYQGQLKPLEVQALIVFIKSLSDKANPADIKAADDEFQKQKAAAKAGNPASPVGTSDRSFPGGVK